LEILDLKPTDPDRVWFSHFAEIEAARAGDHLDAALDAALLDLCKHNKRLVLDTWGLAWIAPSPLVRLWIESDLRSRQWKCFVSQGSPPRRNLDSCLDLVLQKDQGTRETFRRMHNFDLFRDRTRYDIILSNTALIEQPTEAAARRGIRKFAPVVSASVSFLLEGAEAPLLALLETPVGQESILYIRELHQ
jgi:cytidylate kinase